MKLAPAIEEFIRYKQALGNSYATPARSLKAFLRQTGNVDFDDVSAHDVEAFLLGRSGRVTRLWFHRYYDPGKTAALRSLHLFNSRYAAFAGSS